MSHVHALWLVAILLTSVYRNADRKKRCLQVLQCHIYDINGKSLFKIHYLWLHHYFSHWHWTERKQWLMSKKEHWRRKIKRQKFRSNWGASKEILNNLYHDKGLYLLRVISHKIVDMGYTKSNCIYMNKMLFFISTRILISLMRLGSHWKDFHFINRVIIYSSTGLT